MLNNGGAWVIFVVESGSHGVCHWGSGLREWNYFTVSWKRFPFCWATLTLLLLVLMRRGWPSASGRNALCWGVGKGFAGMLQGNATPLDPRVSQRVVCSRGGLDTLKGCLKASSGLCWLSAPYEQFYGVSEGPWIRVSPFEQSAHQMGHWMRGGGTLCTCWCCCSSSNCVLMSCHHHHNQEVLTDEVC